MERRRSGIGQSGRIIKLAHHWQTAIRTELRAREFQPHPATAPGTRTPVNPWNPPRSVVTTLIGIENATLRDSETGRLPGESGERSPRPEYPKRMMKYARRDFRVSGGVSARIKRLRPKHRFSTH